MTSSIRLALIGFGLIGRRHAEIIRRTPELELVAIVEPDTQAQQAAQRLQAPIYPDLASMLAQASPDAVVLATPTPLHLEQGLACIAARLPVLIEKPIAVSASEAQELVDSAHAADVPLLIGHHRRHNGAVQAAKATIDSGTIGVIRAVQATCWFYKPDYYFAAAPWRTRPGAGPISVNLVHDVDLLRHFCGEVLSVQAVAVASRRGHANEDLASAILSFASGAIATISVADGIVAPWSWELTAHENPVYPATNESCYLIGGSEGGLSLPDLRVWRHDQDPDWWAPINASSLLRHHQDPLARQMQHFVEVIKRKQAPLVSGAEGLKSLAVVEAIAQSAAKRCEVVIEAR